MAQEHIASLRSSKMRRLPYAGMFVGLVVSIIVCLLGQPALAEFPDTSLLTRALARGESPIETRVEKILSETPLIDGHNDFPYFLRWAHNNHIYFDNFTVPFESGKLGGHVDLFRLRKGRVGGFFWSIYTDCPLGPGNNTPEYLNTALAEAQNAIDVSHRVQERYENEFGRPHDSSDALGIFESGRIISPLGVEGLHVLGNSFAKLRDYYARGVRYTTLTHNCHNIYADAALEVQSDGTSVVAVPKWNGVSTAGRKLIRELNRLGILVDLSHVSADTMRTTMGAEPKGSNATGIIGPKLPPWEGTLAPPIFSHSSAYAICPHPRNVPDDVLHLVKSHNGIVMINFWKDFISCEYPGGVPIPGELPTGYAPNATLSQVVRHMRYIGDLIGYDHVGIGSDFDGVPAGVEGLEDVSAFPNLVAEMLKQGISDENAKKIVGENLLRVWTEADSVAKKLKESGALPAEDDLADMPDPFA